MAYYNYLGLF
ncbi:hypothetical protein VTL71DRAFT_11653 [Oculimacula yallundae]|uniref:Uncharacterized protein n=1 Tax=Oculimacula yallundae TaxID=86028 RepID=A0ABR4CR30_9HELO